MFFFQITLLICKSPRNKVVNSVNIKECCLYSIPSLKRKKFQFPNSAEFAALYIFSILHKLCIVYLTTTVIVNVYYIVGALIVLTMIGISNSNKTCYQVGCQSRTNACI